MKWPLLMCLIYSPLTIALNENADENAQLKAGMIYRFAQFTAWTNGQPTQLQYCILGDQQVFQEMQTILSENNADVLSLTADDSVDQCDVLYVASDAGKSQVLNLNRQQRSLLTIAENAQLFRQGMVIGFITEPKRLSFRVNLQAAKDQHLTLSSQMLKLAKEIH